MPIGYARVEFVKRSDGKTSCGKAAYNSRSRIEFEGNCAIAPQTFDWSSKEPPEFHSVLLHEGVDSNFLVPEVLWNAVEAKETRYNSQVGLDLVLALPDDKELTLDDRIELAEQFVRNHIVSKGFGAQLDIHSPERRVRFTESDEQLGISKGMKGTVTHVEPDRMVVALDQGNRVVEFNPGSFSGYALKEHNWHAHVLITPRRFREDGQGFEERKPRELMPQVRKGLVVSGTDWGKQWAVHQNRFFEDRGWALRVDPNGVIPQEHLGPVRMRARAFALLEEHGRRLELNALESEDPSNILKKLTEKVSFFTKDDVDQFLQKHVKTESVAQVREAFWQYGSLIRLVDKQSGEVLDKYTSRAVIEEENLAVRLADRFAGVEAYRVRSKIKEAATKGLNGEQQRAFQGIVEGKRLGLLQGYAGTGKGHVLRSLGEVYAKSGISVRAFGPDNATVEVLKEKGFKDAENVYRFLFAAHHGNRTFSLGKEVWLLDEASKLGNRPLIELMKEADKRGAQLVLAGDPAQLSSVDRGGLFDLFCKRYPCQALEEIQRQQGAKQREIARHLAVGEIGGALGQLCETRGLRWTEDKRGAVETLIAGWAGDRRAFPDDRSLIIAHTNAEVRVLNEMARIVRKQAGEIGEREFACETTQGQIFVSEGDRIEFRKNDRELGVVNGLSGEVVALEKDRFVVSVREGERRTRLVSFNPQQYHAYQLGYASTFYRSQGRTVDRAYVLHSDHMNKEMFYVGLTRHVRRAQFYLAKDRVLSLADLKRQLSREGKKVTTQEYTTQEAIRDKVLLEQREKGIQDLKASNEALDRLKGHGLSAWDKIIRSYDEMVGRLKDRRPSKEFYSYTEDGARVKARVVEVDRFRKEPLYRQQDLLSRPFASVVVADSKEAADRAHEKFEGRDYVYVAGKSDQADWGALAGRKVVVWPLNTPEGFKEAQAVCEELKGVSARQIYMMNHPKIFQQLPRGWSLTDEWPKDMNPKMLQFYFPGEEKNRLHLAVFKSVGVPEKDILERSKLAAVLCFFEKRNEEVYLEKVQNAPENEKQKIWDEYKASALNLISRESKIEQDLKQDAMVCVSGDLARRLAYQVLLYEAKHGRTPALEQVLVMKEAVAALSEEASQMTRDRDKGVIRHALDRVGEEWCNRALQRQSFSSEDRKTLQGQLELTEGYLAQQVDRVEALERAQELQRSVGKGKGLDHN